MPVVKCRYCPKSWKNRRGVANHERRCRDKSDAKVDAQKIERGRTARPKALLSSSKQNEIHQQHDETLREDDFSSKILADDERLHHAHEHTPSPSVKTRRTRSGRVSHVSQQFQVHDPPPRTRKIPSTTKRKPSPATLTSPEPTAPGFESEAAQPKPAQRRLLEPGQGDFTRIMDEPEAASGVRKPTADVQKLISRVLDIDDVVAQILSVAALFRSSTMTRDARTASMSVSWTVLAMAQTRSRWRKIALEKGELWSVISVDICWSRGRELLHKQRNRDFLPKYLAYSKQAPLQIGIRAVAYMDSDPTQLQEGVQEVLDILLDHSSRWQFVRLNMSSALFPIFSDVYSSKVTGTTRPLFSSLTHVDIRFSYTFAESQQLLNAPVHTDPHPFDDIRLPFSEAGARIQILSLPFFNSRTSNWDIDLSTSTNLDISMGNLPSHDSITGLSQIFSQASDLRKLCLVIGGASFPETRRLVHNNITQLLLQYDDHPYFLSSLELPALTKLVIAPCPIANLDNPHYPFDVHWGGRRRYTRLTRWSANAFKGMVERSFCSLRELDFRGIEISLKDLKATLEVVSSTLTHFSFHQHRNGRNNEYPFRDLVNFLTFQKQSPQNSSESSSQPLQIAPNLCALEISCAGYSFMDHDDLLRHVCLLMISRAPREMKLPRSDICADLKSLRVQVIGEHFPTEGKTRKICNLLMKMSSREGCDWKLEVDRKFEW